jgi:hypothetical protein
MGSVRWSPPERNFHRTDMTTWYFNAENLTNCGTSGA